MNIKKQMKCNHKEVPAKEIITFKGRTTIMNVDRCAKCGEVSALPREVERARRELNPSLIERFKGLLGFRKLEGAEALVFKGRVL